MFASAVENLVVRHSTARFDGVQAYRLEGDQAHLTAAVSVDDAAAAGADDWALQLWACKPDGLRGIKVAELPVGGLSAAGASLAGWATALPPAGQGAHTMVLALASGGAGRFDHIHDLAVFAAQERFCQPCLLGAVGYRFDGASVELSVGSVANPRDAGNLSGSLSLELWALPQAYEGGAFEGCLIAAADLDCLAGQARIDDLRVSLPATPAPAGTWRIAMMLREWTSAGYVSRDYANFELPLEVEPPVATETPVADEATVPASAAAEAPAAEVAAEPVAPAAKPAEPAKPAAAAAESGRVSVNRASADELAAIKGLSKTVAKAIVAARPYAKLEDIVRAKGVGAKLLEKLRDQLVL